MRIERGHLWTGLLIAGTAVAYSLFVWVPLTRDISATEKDIEVAEQELGIARDRTDGLRLLAEEVGELRRQVASTKKVVPAFDELSTMLGELSVQVENEHLTRQNISTDKTRATSDYICLPVEVKVDGSSVSVFRFVHRIEDMPSMVRMNGLTVTGDPRKGDEVHAEIRMDAFFCPEPEVQP